MPLKRLILILSGMTVFFLAAGCSVKTEPNLSLEDPLESVVEEEKPDAFQEEEEEEVTLDLSAEEEEEMDPEDEMTEEEHIQLLKNTYGDREVTVFGENIDGVMTGIRTDEKIAALTFDACGGPQGSAFDEDLITYLMEERIPATLFINGRWIEENKEIMEMLSQHELFDIENHGYGHKPLSMDGQSAYGIRGTEGIEEVFQEIMKNQQLILSHTGRTPRYFRSGTAFYDDVALEILKELNLKAVNYDVLGDAGATFNKEQMVRSARGVKPGSIFLYHMNHPNKEIREGIKQVIPMLREMGYDFVKLSDYDDSLK